MKQSEIIDYLAFGLGESWEEQNGFELVCKVGDATYKKFLEKINESFETRYERRLNRLEEMPGEENNGRSKKLIEIVKKTKDIDYSLAIQQQVPESNNLPSVTDNLPISIFDSHVHSYFIIKDYFKKCDKPITLVRFDAHSDCDLLDVNDYPDRTNYVARLMIDKDVSEKIKKVVTVSGEMIPGIPNLENNKEIAKSFSEKSKCYIINNIPHFNLSIFDLPEINGPSILDIDLDGHEVGMPNGVPGGYYTARPSLSMLTYDNQNRIKIHPRLAVNTLQKKVKNPKQICIATEKSYRNALFIERIELDFFNALLT